MPIKTCDSPAVEQMRRLTSAFDIFNEELFEGQLPSVMLQLRNKPGTWGYFQLNKWTTPDGELLDVISLDSSTANERPLKQLASTLVHEMCHSYVCNFVCDRKSTGGHRKEWRAEMDRLGLPPVKGGATWRTATHKIAKGGLFETVFARREAELETLPWRERVRQGKKGARGQDRARFECPECHESFWARPSLKALCGTCSAEGLLVQFLSSASTPGGNGSPLGADPYDAPPARLPGLPVWTDEASRELRLLTGLEYPPTNTTEALQVLTSGMDEHREELTRFLKALEEQDDTYESLLRGVYKVRARRLHPDAGGSEEAFKVLQIAYRILCRPETKDKD